MRRKLGNKIVNKRKIFIVILLIFGFMVLEFPGILIVGKITQPVILGVPFLYAYILVGWIYMLCVMGYGLKTSWGKKPFFRAKNN